MDENKKILIAGGAGFIGSHLCNYLIKKNKKIICLDNLISGKIENISQHLKNENFQFIEHDIENPFYSDEVSEIYNLACPASPIQYQKNPIKTIKSCTVGTINLLGLAKKNNAKILQASTSEVYGDPEIHPQIESYNGNVNFIGKRSCYDEGKRVSESLFVNYHKFHGVKIKIARIFNTFGSNMSKNDGRVVSNFINQALNGKDITVYGDGSQTRSFQYIDDTINALVAIMNSNDMKTGPFNVGNPDEISIKTLAKKILVLTNSNSSIAYNDLPFDDPKKRKPDISLIYSEIGWKPIFDLDFGLKQTINYFKNIL